MNDNQPRRGPGLWPLLLIPAALIIAKGARRRRAMWASGGAGYGHRRGWGPGFDPDNRADFRLPPKIESMLGAWHARVHETNDSLEPSSSTGPTTA
jgi:hypothetical protein